MTGFVSFRDWREKQGAEKFPFRDENVVRHLVFLFLICIAVSTQLMPSTGLVPLPTTCVVKCQGRQFGDSAKNSAKTGGGDAALLALALTWFIAKV